MKIFILLTILGCQIGYATESYAQTAVMSINLKNKTVKEVFSEIEKNSEYSFFYRDGVVDLERKVSINLKNEKIDVILNKLFNNTNNAYVILDKQITITRKRESIPPPPSPPTVEVQQELSAEQMQQGITITGKVVDAEGMSMPGVNVIIKETTRGVVSDINGEYSITVPDRDAVLVFSFVGYATHEQIVGELIAIDVQMKEVAKDIDEVVVVGYGTQKKATMVGSVSQAKGDDILKTGAVTTISQAIQGLMPGVVSIANTSQPGADKAEVIIRGKGTWGGTSPLCLVDGVERDINDIDPNEIESISVLKDAAATAVFGVKGGNGVIIVTTKRGLNQRPAVNFTANFGFKQPTMKPEYADYVTSMKMWNEAAANDMNWGEMIPQSTIAAWENAFATGNYGPNNDYFPEIDWWNRMIKRWGYQQQYNLNIRGGTDFVKYFVSFGFLNDGDIFQTEKTELFNPAFNYKRYNWRTNLDFNLTPTTTVSVNLAGKQGNRNQPGMRATDNADNPNNSYMQDFFEEMYSAPRHTFPVQWSDGEYGTSFDGSGNLALNFARGQRTYKYYENFIDVGVKQSLDFITKGLSAQAKFSYTANNGTQSRIQLHRGTNFGAGGSDGNSIIRYYRQWDYTQQLPDGGFALLSSLRHPIVSDFLGETHLVAYDIITQGAYGRKMKYEASIAYDRRLGKHAVTALGVFERYENEGLMSNSATNMKFQEREEAWVTRLTYNYDERYLFEFSGAYTGSMRFARGMRFKFFPAYSVGWRPTEEPFIREMIGTDVLSDFKIRYSYGTVGYDRNAEFFTYVQTYSVEGANSGVQLGINYPATTYGPFIIEGQTANVKATWETAYKQNLGFDFGMFNNSLTGSFDLFKERREGILMDATTPGWFGLGNPDANLGRTKTRGLEVTLGWNSTIGDVRYRVSTNFSANENRVLERNDAFMEEEHRKLAGKPIDMQRRLGVAGYYASIDDIFNYAASAEQPNLTPGDFMYIDYNADGSIVNDPSDQLAMKEQNYPRTTYGWTVGCSWKNFDFSMMWYGVLGVYKNVVGEMLWDLGDGLNYNYYANPNVLNRWTPETAATASKPALHTLNLYRSYNERGSTYTYQNASYLRLKTLEVSYSLNKNWIGKISMSNCQFYVNGNNLLTFTKFNKYIDPEGNSVTLYPMVRRFNLGVRIGF